MTARDGFYSTLVAWLKILLPLAALALLSSLFLLSRTNHNSGDLPFSFVELQERAREEIISQPRFSGASRSGDLISFAAQSAKPDAENGHLAHASDLQAEIILKNGTVVTFEAGQALLDTRDNIAHLVGGVTVESSTGYVLQSEDLTAHMNEVGAETSGQVTGSGPGGQITAGKMLLTSDPETGDAHLLFTNGVKLVYQPRN